MCAVVLWSALFLVAKPETYVCLKLPIFYGQSREFGVNVWLLLCNQHMQPGDRSYTWFLPCRMAKDQKSDGLRLCASMYNLTQRHPVTDSVRVCPHMGFPMHSHFGTSTHSTHTVQRVRSQFETHKLSTQPVHRMQT